MASNHEHRRAPPTRLAHRGGRAFVAGDARPPPWTSLRRRSAKSWLREHGALLEPGVREAALGLARGAG